jgi:type IV secretory pathway VirJ component
MTTKVAIKVVNTLPGTFDPSTLYMVKSADAGLFEMYMSTMDGASVRHILNKSEITTMITQALAGFNTVQIVADITARDALAPTVITQALVLDASADATVDSGAATYVFDPGTSTWTKISEAESMDVVLQWANIVGKPTSSVTDIDDAVTKRHTHTNKTQLDKIGEDGDGFLTYNGTTVGATASVVEW